MCIIKIEQIKRLQLAGCFTVRARTKAATYGTQMGGKFKTHMKRDISQYILPAD